ncbi:MAG: hypothetical protein ACE5LA_07130 [Dehalococcoidales bacterium]
MGVGGGDVVEAGGMGVVASGAASVSGDLLGSGVRGSVTAVSGGAGVDF